MFISFSSVINVLATLFCGPSIDYKSQLLRHLIQLMKFQDFIWFEVLFLAWKNAYHMHLSNLTAFKLNLVLSFIESLAGTYELIPYYKGENTVFDVSPPVMSVTVEHQHVTVPQKFQVRCIMAYKVIQAIW